MADLAIWQVWAARVFHPDFVDVGKYSILLACSTCMLQTHTANKVFEDADVKSLEDIVR